jgi:hypothetical protein
VTSAAEELARLRRALESAEEASGHLTEAAEKATEAADVLGEALEGSSAPEALVHVERAREKLTEASQYLHQGQEQMREYAAEAHGANLDAPLALPGATPAGPDRATIPDDLTYPSRPPDPNAVPGGVEEVSPRANARMQDDLRFQDEAAHAFARAGYQVRRLAKADTGRSPDYEIEGRVFDCYQAGPETSLANIRTKMRSKAKNTKGQTQARRCVVGLEHSQFGPEDVRRYLRRNPSSRIVEAFVIKRGSITRVWP